MEEEEMEKEQDLDEKMAEANIEREKMVAVGKIEQDLNHDGMVSAMMEYVHLCWMQGVQIRGR